MGLIDDLSMAMKSDEEAAAIGARLTEEARRAEDAFGKPAFHETFYGVLVILAYPIAALAFMGIISASGTPWGAIITFLVAGFVGFIGPALRENVRSARLLQRLCWRIYENSERRRQPPR